MNDKLTFPASCTRLTAEESACILGGAEAEGFELFLDNVGMLNSFLTTYNTIQQLNDYINKNF